MKRIGLIIGLMLAAVAAHATVTSQTTSVSFTCTGSTGPYPFTFSASAPAALTVTENGTLLSPTLYTVTAVNNNLDNGGSVTLNSACALGTLVLTRVTPLTQTSVFTDNMPVPMKTFENGLDKLTEIDQELWGDIALLYTPQSPNLIFAGPASGSSAPPTFRPLVPADIPFTLVNGSVCTGTGSSQVCTFPGAIAVGGSTILSLKCDGSTDNYASIAAALTSYLTVQLAPCQSGAALIGNAAGSEYLSLTTQGQTLIFGPGLYNFTLDARNDPFDAFTGIAPIMIRASNVTVAGLGQQSSRLVLTPTATSGTPQFPLLVESLPAACSTGAVGCTSTISNVSVNQLSLDGNSSDGGAACPATDTNGDGVQLMYVQTGSVNKNAVNNICFQSIVTYGAPSAPVRSISITQNTIGGFGEIGVGLEGITQQSFVGQNVIRGNLATANTEAVAVYSLSAIGGTGTDNQDNEVASNVIASSATTGGKVAYGVLVEDGALRTNVHDNTITGSANGLQVITITNADVAQSVHLHDNTLAGITDTTSGAIRASGGGSSYPLTGLEIVNNKFQGTIAGAGIFVTYATAPKIALNKMQGCGTAAGTRQECIFIDADTTPSIVGNDMLGYGNYAVNFNSSAVTSPVLGMNNCAGECSLTIASGVAVDYNVDSNATFNSVALNAGAGGLATLYLGNPYQLVYSVGGSSVFLGDVGGHGMETYVRTGGSNTMHLQTYNGSSATDIMTLGSGGTTFGGQVQMNAITGHGSKGPVCSDASGNLYVSTNNTGTGAPCP